MRLFGDTLPSFVGTLGLAVDEKGAVARVAFLDRGGRDELVALATSEGDEVELAPERCARARGELEEYLRGERRAFDVALAMRGSAFQMAVWNELVRVPYGATESYGELARRVGQPGASRAVGQANHVNPIPILVPCHRIVGADGALTGFGGGLDVKRALLDFERGQRGFAF